MPPVASFIATLVSLGVAFLLVPLISLGLDLPDLVALLLFALPITGYIAYCTVDASGQVLPTARRIYLAFAGVVLAASALVLSIG